MDRDRKGPTRPPPVSHKSAALTLRFELKGRARYSGVRLELDSVRFRRGDDIMQVALHGHGLELRPRRSKEAELEIAAPPGAWDAVELRIRRVLVSIKRSAWSEVASSVALESGNRLDLTDAKADSVSFRASLKDLRNARALDPAPVPIWHVVAGQRAETVRLARHTLAGLRTDAELRIQPRSFLPGTVITLAPRGPGGLPALFRGQHALGPILQLSASTAPRAPFELALAYHAADAAAAAIRPADIVVLQLSEDRQTYHELRPHRIDPVNHTVHVRASALSHFFACTPGISIQQPEVVIDQARDVVAYPLDERALITGRVIDDRASVSLPGLPHGASWVTQGWFLFEDVQLGPSDTSVEIRAQVDGLIAHTCTLLVRRAFPRKTISRPGPWFAGSPIWSGDGTPFVATVLTQPVTLDGVANVDPVRPFLDTATADRNVPALFWFDSPSDAWQSIELLPRWFQEEEVARRAIPEIRRYTDFDPQVNAAYPEETRHLQSLADFFAGVQGNQNAVGTAIITGIASNESRARYLTLSPRVPLITLGAREVGAAFVVTTAAGNTTLRQGALGEAVARYHVPRRLEHSLDFGIRGGRLFFARATPAGVVAREVVADNILCGPLSMRPHPLTGEPALLAFELPADPGQQFFLARLALFSRQPAGNWQREIVWEADRIVEADFEFDAGGAPHVVAAIGNANDYNGQLHYLTRAAGWSAQPLSWEIAGQGVRRSSGMFPRVTVDDQQRPCVAFTLFEDDLVTWIVAQLDAGAWRARTLGFAVKEDLTGVADAEPPRDFPEDVVGRSRVSAHYWAPALAAGAPGTLWCAWGSGVTHLSAVNTSFNASDDRIVDIDRTTGFLPQFALRPTGAPAVAYKDVHGGERFDPIAETQVAAGPDLHLFELAASHQVSRPVAYPRLVPRRRVERGNLSGFGRRVPFSCDKLIGFVEAVALSAVFDIFGQEGGLSAAEQSQLLDEILASLILNERVDLFAWPPQNRVEIVLNNTNPSEASALQSLRITRRGNAPATLIATDAEGNSGDGVCGITQEGWNSIAGQFLDLPLDPTSLFPTPPGITVDAVEIRGIRISWSTDTAPTPQQGGIRFRIDVPDIRVVGSRSGVGFTATATEPTVLEFVLAPFVVDGGVQWVTRSVSGRIGHIDVDAELDFLTWIGIIATVLAGSPIYLVLVVVDPVVGTIATDQTNDQIASRRGVPLGGIPDTLRRLLNAYALRQAFGLQPNLEGVEFEAVDLDGLDIRYHLRAPRIDLPPRLGIAVTPAPLRVGAAHIGEETAPRACLVENPEMLPVSLDAITVVGSHEFIVTAPQLPQILPSGYSEIVRVRLRPTGAPGDRAARLRFAFNQHETFDIDLLGIAFPALEPSISVVPGLLQFGVVNVGATRTLALEIRNEGQATLLVTEARIEGGDAALFATTAALPLQVPAGQATTIQVQFTPAAMVAGGHTATLILVSNARNEPNLSVPLSGSGAAGNLLVQPTQIVFNQGQVGFPIGSRRPFTVYNLGAASFTLAGSSFQPIDVGTGQPSQHFQLLDAAGQPMPVADRVLAAGAFLALSVEFLPRVVGVLAAELRMASTDGMQGPVVVSVRGTGVP
jgi:hypothetical protein